VRTGGEQLSDDSLDGCVEIGRDLADEPDAKRGLGVEALARDEVAPRSSRPDLRERERRRSRQG